MCVRSPTVEIAIRCVLHSGDLVFFDPGIISWGWLCLSWSLAWLGSSPTPSLSLYLITLRAILLLSWSCSISYGLLWRLWRLDKGVCNFGWTRLVSRVGFFGGVPLGFCRCSTRDSYRWRRVSCCYYYLSGGLADLKHMSWCVHHSSYLSYFGETFDIFTSYIWFFRIALAHVLDASFPVG